MITVVLKRKGGHWLSPSRMLKYQVVLLLEQDDVYLRTTTAVNPVAFSTTDQVKGELESDCLQAIERIYSS